MKIFSHAGLIKCSYFTTSVGSVAQTKAFVTEGNFVGLFEKLPLATAQVT